MTEQEKQLLLIDICGRLPYGVLGLDCDGKIRKMVVIYPSGTIIAKEIDGENCSSCGFKPYLRPMSSMTEEELNNCINQSGIKDVPCPQINTFKDRLEFSITMFITDYKCIDWLNSHHFDYRGLIEMGLAIEVTKENNPYKQ